MVDEPRPGARSRSAGTGDLHEDSRFRARLPRFRRQREAGLRGGLMADTSFLAWPFFEDRHRAFHAALEAWCKKNLPVAHDDVDAACRALVSALGRDGWLAHTAIDPDHGG